MSQVSGYLRSNPEANHRYARSVPVGTSWEYVYTITQWTLRGMPSLVDGFGNVNLANYGEIRHVMR